MTTITLGEIAVSVIAGLTLIGVAFVIGMFWAAWRSRKWRRAFEVRRQERKWEEEKLADGRTLYTTSPDVMPEEVEKKIKEVRNETPRPETTESAA